jgi:short-subunit dehydrogenase
LAVQGRWLITGASSGLGLALAQAVVRRGGIVLAATRRPDTLAEVAQRWPGRLIPFALDAGDTGGAAEAVARAGQIDVLVNNAGYGLLGAVEETSEAEARVQLEVNFFGPAAITRAVLPQMRERGLGLIVNVTSVSGVLGQPGSAYYAASKFAVEGFSDALRKECAPLGIRVMIVEPGPVRTDFFDRGRKFAAERIADYELVEARRQSSGERPGVQAGDPVRCAGAILQALASDTPPERLALGAPATEVIEATLEYRLGEVRRLAPLARSADFPMDKL